MKDNIILEQSLRRLRNQAIDIDSDLVDLFASSYVREESMVVEGLNNLLKKLRNFSDDIEMHIENLECENYEDK